MRIIEKKCPNCGAGLEFNETARVCKCDYCKRSFVIEHDENIKTNDIAEHYRLSNSNKKLLTIIFVSFLLPTFSPIIIYFMIFISIFFVSIFAIPNEVHHQLNSPTIKNIGDNENDEKRIHDINEISDIMLNRIKTNSEFIANQTAKGQRDLTYSFQKCEDLILEKMYFAHKDDSNSVITIYKTKYHNFWDQSNIHTVYIPIVYNNISNDNYLLNGKNPAPEYYFNSEKTTYIYAYASFEDAYNSVVKPLEIDHKISQK